MPGWITLVITLVNAAVEIVKLIASNTKKAGVSVVSKFTKGK